MNSLYPYTSFAKAALNSTSNGFLTTWKYSSFLVGGIVFAGTLSHCLYDTYKHGFGLYIRGGWSLLSSFCNQVYNNANPTTPIPEQAILTVINEQFGKLKINKIRYIMSSTIISASLAPMITYSMLNQLVTYALFNPIERLYNRFYYENPRFEFLTKRLQKIKEKEEQNRLLKDAVLLNSFNERIVPNDINFVEDKPDDCHICAIKLEDSDQPLSCGHYFHKECFIKTKNTTCPVCRTEVKMSFEDYKLIKSGIIINPELPSFSSIEEEHIVMENIE